jgi:hypothetical protein
LRGDARTAPITPGSRSKGTARSTNFPLRPRGKHADAVELRVVVAEVLFAAADAVLVVHNLRKLGAHLVAILARLHVQNLAQRNILKAGRALGEKGRGETGRLKKILVSVWHGRQYIPAARASQTGEWAGSTTSISRAVGAAQNVLRVDGRGREICFDHVPLAVRKGRQSRDTLAAEEEQLGKCTAGRLYPSWRSTFGEFESLVDSFVAGAPPPTHL